MKTGIEMVAEFHEKFGLTTETDGPGYILNDEAAEYRIKFLHEELLEYVLAHANCDQVTAFDSLLDLAYVAYGTALLMGITPQQWHEGFTVVHSCNMAKERATSADQSKRGSTLDVIKPDGWTGPEHALGNILGLRAMDNQDTWQGDGV